MPELWLAPRKIFPPPITIATSQPASTIDLISWAYCERISELIIWLLSPPLRASPLNFRRIRLYFSSDIEGVFYSKVRVKFLSLKNFEGRNLN